MSRITQGIFSHPTCGLLATTTIALLLGSSLSAQTTRRLTVHPIQVCDDDGITCANLQRELFLAEADKIWLQANIDIEFLDWSVMHSTTHLTSASITEIASAPGNQAMGGNVVNMWFVDRINDGGAFGFANASLRATMVANSVFSYFGGAGRRDTISHELGHVLNLPHIEGDFPLNLMESGGSRLATTSIDQIFPDGDMRSQLTADQLQKALKNPHLEITPLSILGDANLDDVVNQTDIDFFIAGWKHSQLISDLTTWQKGDFNLDGTTNLADAYILHEALLDSGQEGLDFSVLGQVPEPSCLVLAIFTLATWQCSRAGRRRIHSRS